MATEPTQTTRMARISWTGGQIVTINSDGGTSAWTVAEATDLHRRLGEILRYVGPEKEISDAAT